LPDAHGAAGIIAVLLVAGWIGGFFVATSDIANPVTHGADARRTDLETDLIAKKAEIDQTNYAEVEEARKQAEIEKTQLAVQPQKAAQEQTLATQREWDVLNLQSAQAFRLALAVSIVCIGIAVSIGLGSFLVRMAAAHFSSYPPTTTINDPWSNPAWRTERRLQARAVERAERLNARLRQQPDSARSNGHQQHTKLPVQIAYRSNGTPTQRP